MLSQIERPVRPEEKKKVPAEFSSQAAAVLDSSELFGGKKLVLIRHNGDWYRLVLTRQNKLILMK